MLAAEDNHLGASRMPFSAGSLPRRREWKHGKMLARDLAGFVMGRNFPHWILRSGVFLEPNPRLLIEGDSRENALFWLFKTNSQLIDTKV